MRVLPLALAAMLLAGCFGADADPLAGLVPYPRVGDQAVYEVSGSLVELSRWDNGVPLAAAKAQLRYTLLPSPPAIDASRAQHDAFKLKAELAEAGVFGFESERLVSVRHQALVQSLHPLSQDQNVVAFDERGYPWLWGASALVGEELREGAVYEAWLWDNLGLGADLRLELAVEGDERVDGQPARRVALRGPGVNGTLHLGAGSPWPLRVAITLTEEAAPWLRSDGGFPVSMEARRLSLTHGAEPMPPRDRGASFGEDRGARRMPWNGEMPPDGEAGALPYPLSEAARDAKLLDKPLADWLAAADSPILYRATFQEEPGPLAGSTSAHWLLSWVSRDGRYYEVQVSRLHAPPLPLGVPRVESSAPVDPPSNPDHGWFDPAGVPETLVPLSEGIRIMRETFGAGPVQVFLRSFARPPGHSYFLDGGFEEGGVGRYTVVYNPSTGLLEQATGPVTPRLAE